MELKILNIGILTWLTFLPVLGMVVVLLLPKEQKSAIRWTSLVVTLLQVIFAFALFSKFDRSLGGVNSADTMQFSELFTWINIKSTAWFGTIKIDYFLGVDGISMPMVFLTAIISCIAVISSWTIEKSIKGYFALLLLLDTGMMGVFVALDFFLFYIFWEIILPDRCVGRSPARVCSDQVLSLYITRFRLITACYSCVVFQRIGGRSCNGRAYSYL